MVLQGDDDDTMQGHEDVSGTLTIRIPRTVKLSETFPIVAQFKPDSYYVYSLSTSLKLESPSFKIISIRTPQFIGGGEEFNWRWLTSPEKTGRHALSIRFEPEIPYRIDEYIRSRDLELDSNSVIAYITVLTDLDLTATQDAILKIVGATIGILGTILGYPFLKRYFDTKNNPAGSQQGQGRKWKNRKPRR